MPQVLPQHVNRHALKVSTAGEGSAKGLRSLYEVGYLEAMKVASSGATPLELPPRINDRTTPNTHPQPHTT